jgi:hypothetical protein
MLPWQLIIPALVLSALTVAAVLVVAARRSSATRPWLVIAALGVAAMPLAIVLHNVLSALSGGEEGVTFVVAVMVAPVCIAIGILGAGIALRDERRDLAVGVLIAGIGIAAFGLLSLFAFIDDDAAAPFQVIIVPATVAAVVGAVWSVMATVGRRLTA